MRIVPDNWTAIFTLQTPLMELAVRGAVLFLSILVLMRIMPRRAGGELATMDLVLVLLIANAAANALGSYTALPDGLVVIVTIMMLDYLVNALSYRVAWIERLVSSPPLQVIRDGKLLRRNMRREFLTEEELMSYLRQSGVDQVASVKAAYVEGEGKITVVTHHSQHS